MDNVISFPTKAVRDRAELMRIVRETLQTANVPPDAAEIVVANMAEFIDLLNLDFSISVTVPAPFAASVGKQLEDFSVFLQKRTAHLLIERLKVEIKSAIAATT